MKKSIVFIVLFFLLWFCTKQPEYKTIPLIQGTDVVFADSAFAAGIVVTEDDYTRVLSEYDRKAGMNSDSIVTQAEYLQHLARNVKNWDDSTVARFEIFSKNISPRLSALNIVLPEKIIMINTTSKEIGGAAAAYTRQNAIMLSYQVLSSPDSLLQDVFIHEIFHVYSRQNPQKQEELYKIVGFRKTNEIEVPEAWQKRLITNPDAPLMNTVIDVKKDGEEITVTPFIYAFKPYDPKGRSGIFQSLVFELLKVEDKNGRVEAVFKNNLPVTFQVRDVKDYWDQIGRNTNYIIHPEEIIASNFVFLVNEKKDLKNPEIVEEMKQVIMN